MVPCDIYVKLATNPACGARSKGSVDCGAYACGCVCGQSRIQQRRCVRVCVRAFRCARRHKAPAAKTRSLSCTLENPQKKEKKNVVAISVVKNIRSQNGRFIYLFPRFLGSSGSHPTHSHFIRGFVHQIELGTSVMTITLHRP